MHPAHVPTGVALPTHTAEDEDTSRHRIGKMIGVQAYSPHTQTKDVALVLLRASAPTICGIPVCRALPGRMTVSSWPHD